MAKNTGFQQAVYAAKFTAKGKIPLDVDGNFCSISGKKQAIIVLEGHKNPNPSKYEVEGSFKEGAVIDDYPTMVYNTDACPLPEPEYDLPDTTVEKIESRYFEVRPNTAVLAEDAIPISSGGFGALSFTPINNRDWDDPKGKSIPPASWTEGGIVQETLRVRRIGEYYWNIENFKIDYNLYGSYTQYALKQSQLDNASIPLTVEENNQKTGAFFNGGITSNKFFKQVKVYPKRTLPIGVNPNYWGKKNIKNVIPDKIDVNIPFNMIEDKNWSTIILPHRLFKNGEVASDIYRSLTIWREDPENSIMRITNSFGEYQGINNNHFGAVYEIDNVKICTNRMAGQTPAFWFVSIRTNGRSFEELPKIKIEYGDKFTGWVDCLDGTEENGWELPDKADFMQLFGMVGLDLSYLNLRKNLFVKPIDKDIPWINNYHASSQCKDLLGARFLPIGHKNNGDKPGVNGSDGEIYNYGQKIAFLTKTENLKKPSDSSPALWLTDVNMKYNNATVVWDIANKTTKEGSAQYWQKNVRLCRRLTDTELGYKLWVDEANNKILVTKLADKQPAGTKELEKGLLRGLAVRWMNEDKTKVLASLSKLLEEVEKTKDGGGYGWYGFYTAE